MLQTSGEGSSIAEAALTLGGVVTVEDLKNLCFALGVGVGSGRLRLADLASRVAEHIYGAFPEPRRSELISAAIASVTRASVGVEEMDEGYAALIDEVLSHDKD